MYGRVSDGGGLATALKLAWGKAIADVRVAAGTTGTGEYLETVSDADGYFEFVGLSGTYALEARTDACNSPQPLLDVAAPRPGRCVVQNIGLTPTNPAEPRQ